MPPAASTLSVWARRAIAASEPSAATTARTILTCGSCSLCAMNSTISSGGAWASLAASHSTAHPTAPPSSRAAAARGSAASDSPGSSDEEERKTSGGRDSSPVSASSSAQRVPRSQTGSLPSFEKPSRRPMTEVGDGPPGLGASSVSSASWYSRGSIATAATTRSRSAELSSSRLLSSGSGKASSIIPVTLPARSSSPCLARALMRW
mmetsp:Transcript_21072/g.68670  ORF Transcript_21072/g.68670 Transcript_21072/m.68670 type:complete len:207 (+) Transcript_21072:697-1317(+)